VTTQHQRKKSHENIWILFGTVCPEFLDKINPVETRMTERPFWKSMLINLIEGFDEQKFKELMKDKRYNFEAIFRKFFCYMIILLPLLSIMSAFFVTYFVASIVFTFQGKSKNNLSNEMVNGVKLTERD
jgi:DNA integrity scanning protein DisA with diadenylate cyclase activity